MLAERYVVLFIVRENLSSLALDRALIWISFLLWFLSREVPDKAFYIWIQQNNIVLLIRFYCVYIRKRVNGILLFLFFLCHCGSAFFPFVFFFLLVFVASLCRFTASRMQWSFVTYILKKYRAVKLIIKTTASNLIIL